GIAHFGTAADLRLGKRVVEVFRRALEKKSGHGSQKARDVIEQTFGSRLLLRRLAQPAGNREKALMAIDNPDARLGTPEAAQDALHLARSRNAGAKLEKLRPIVQRSRHGARGRREGFLLPG